MAAKERSPHYPALGLETTVQLARMLYDKEKRSVVTAEGIAKAIGYEGLSGIARTKIATMRQFGLIDSVGGGKYKLSDRGLTFALRSPSDPEYAQAAKAAALTPELFADLFSNYPDASEYTIRIHLIQDRKFSDDGATKAYKAFRDTIGFARLDASSASGSVEELLSDGDEIDVDSEPSLRAAATTNASFDAGARVVNMKQSWLLAGGVAAEIYFTGKVTAKAIDRLVAHLSLLREDIADEESAEDI